MEDAHAAVLDLQPHEGKGENGDGELVPAAGDVRISFFGVYDGHGGDKVALYTGEHLHKIIAKQESFKKLDFEQALKDGFLAIDRAILSGVYHHAHVNFTSFRVLTNIAWQIQSTKKRYLVVPRPWPLSRTRRSTAYVGKTLLVSRVS